MTFSSNEPGAELEKELTRLRPVTPRLPEPFRLSLRQRLRYAPVPSPSGEHTMLKLNRFAAAAAVVVIVLVVGLFVRTYIGSAETEGPVFQPGQSGEEETSPNIFTPTPIASPIVPAEATIDLSADDDGDGLTNAQEIELGTLPDRADSDRDGLSDGDEVNIHRTDPWNPDTDMDGLFDGDEINETKTSPLNADTDGDSIGDALDDDPLTAAAPTPLPPTAVPPTDDAVWIEAVAPQSGTTLVGPGAIPVTITLGYVLNTADSAELLVQIQRPNGDGSGYGLGETTATLPRGRGSITVTVLIERPAEVGDEPRNVGLLVTLWNINAEKALFTDFPVGYEWLLIPDSQVE